MKFKLFLLLIIICNSKINSYLIFPLEYLHDKYYSFNTKNNKASSEEIIQQIYYKNLITKLEIGTPSIHFSMLLDINTEKYYITSINKGTNQIAQRNLYNIFNFNNKDYFNENISTSYKNILIYHEMHGYGNSEEICLSTEKIIFNNKTKDNPLIYNRFPIRFKRFNNNNIPGYIGLLYNKSYNEYEYGEKFITELKKSNLIDNYYWFFDFDEISPLTKKIKAQFIIGELPHDVFPQKYSINDFVYTNSHIVYFGKDAWRLYIDKVYVYNNTQNFKFENTNIILSYEIYNIIGNKEFHDKIKEIFMDKLIIEKKCFINKFSENNFFVSNISFYYCYKSVENILYENIPNIKFNSLNLDFTFEFTKDELFYTKDNYIYFMILFSSLENSNWIMGQMLTTKYNFVFNQDKIRIGLYKKVNKIKNDKDKYDYRINNNINISLIVFIIIIGGFIFCCCGLIIGRRVFIKKRKIIVNELIEERDYEYKTHNDEVKSKYNSISYNKKDGILIEMNKKIND